MKNTWKIIISVMLFSYCFVSCENTKYKAYLNGKKGVLMVDKRLRIDLIYLCSTGPDTISYIEPNFDVSILKLYNSSSLCKQIETNDIQSFKLRVECTNKMNGKQILFREYYDVVDVCDIIDTFVCEGYR